jgi:antitoxin Phd
METTMARSERRRSVTEGAVRRGRPRAWKLEDAKARFSEVVRLARSVGPQHVTVRGQDAVVVVSAEEFAALLPSARQPSLHALLSTSPLRHVELRHDGQAMPVRDVPL